MSEPAAPPPGPAGTVQCEITQQWVPEDEVITIHGHRVCAAGKAELLERLRSGELLPGEMERPSGFRRVVCYGLDLALMAIVGFALNLFMLGTTFFQMGQAGAAVAWGAELIVASVIGVLINSLYYTLLHGAYGQTLGKMALKLKVVNPDGTPITMGTAFVRTLVFAGPAFLASLIAASIFVVTQNPFAVMANLLYFAAIAYLLVSLVVALVDRAHQLAIHDRLAKTRVIRLH